ncbi:hypothetical protein BJ508DRAFT_375822 [Ascobolus immersus RN42]|uniref:Secreted protein n=1 Tax=Ascobolus immersus RN42 TaxID=1160509 RepID=A0A3N4I8F3_ASCIM|nr:hypothetical protein BJ508DRAFT_375822 [Ascobolus immersus RN42]
MHFLAISAVSVTLLTNLASGTPFIKGIPEVKYNGNVGNINCQTRWRCSGGPWVQSRTDKLQSGKLPPPEDWLDTCELIKEKYGTDYYQKEDGALFLKNFAKANPHLDCSEKAAPFAGNVGICTAGKDLSDKEYEDYCGPKK